MAAHDSSFVDLPYLKHLRFQETHVTIDGKDYAYSDVRHLEFKAQQTRSTLYGLTVANSYETKLALHLNYGPKVVIHMERPLLFRKRAFADFLRAATILQGMTFTQRAEHYEAQMEQRGFVEWGRFQINKEGQLFENDVLVLDLKSKETRVSLDKFEATCAKKSRGFLDRVVGSGSYVIDLTTDRDCFVYVMHKYLGITWSGEIVPVKRMDGMRVFKTALLTLGARLCKIDGHIAPEEIRVFKKHFGIDEQSFPEASRIFKEAAQSRTGIEETARHVHRLLDGQREPLEFILFGLMQVAAADGQIDEKEASFIRTVAEEFEFREREVEGLFALFSDFYRGDSASGSEENSRDSYKSTASTYSSIYRKHLSILGLDKGVTFAEIKTRYREMARQHHPDILRSKGIPIDEIRNSEEILKAINASYEWLASHHGERSARA